MLYAVASFNDMPCCTAAFWSRSVNSAAAFNCPKHHLVGYEMKSMRSGRSAAGAAVRREGQVDLFMAHQIAGPGQVVVEARRHERVVVRASDRIHLPIENAAAGEHEPGGIAERRLMRPRRRGRAMDVERRHASPARGRLSPRGSNTCGAGTRHRARHPRSPGRRSWRCRIDVGLRRALGNRQKENNTTQ